MRKMDDCCLRTTFFSLETFGKYRLLGKAFEDFVIGLLILLDPNTIAGFGVDKALLF